MDWSRGGEEAKRDWAWERLPHFERAESERSLERREVSFAARFDFVMRAWLCFSSRIEEAFWRRWRTRESVECMASAISSKGFFYEMECIWLEVKCAPVYIYVYGKYLKLYMR